MSEGDSQYHDPTVPVRALLLSLSALLVPVGGALSFPGQLGEAGALLWLTALIPAFLLSYYRGWRGVATALALGMAVLSLTQVVAILLDRQIPDTLFWVVVAYLAIAFGIGWVAELLHRQRANVEALALTDLLTHLPNRRHARVFLENEFGAAQRGRMLAVVLFDLDNFKEYNDRYGHQAGDDALREFGRILVSNTRRMNLSARFGGEEFVTILAGSNEEGGLAFAQRVREALRTTPLPNGSVTFSAGVASYHPSMRSPDELVAAADLALYRAKREGRDGVRVFGRPLDLAPPPPDALEEAGLESPRPAPASAVPAEAGAREGAEPAKSTAAEGPERRSPRAYPRSEEDIGRSRPSVSLLPDPIGRRGEGRSLLSEEARERESEVRDTVLQSARALVRAVELRDPHTRGHSARVAAYAVTLAKHISSAHATIDLASLRLAGELHDVGKIAIPDAVLNKESPLTAEEILEIKRYPGTGRRILEPLLDDDVVLAVAGWHHERWDGQGYPDGLAGEAIPLAVRIVAVADVLDAMTSSRAYRSERTWQEAVHAIESAGGTHFDPDLMDPFRAALPALEELFHSSQE